MPYFEHKEILLDGIYKIPLCSPIVLQFSGVVFYTQIWIREGLSEDWVMGRVWRTRHDNIGLYKNQLLFYFFIQIDIAQHGCTVWKYE